MTFFQCRSDFSPLFRLLDDYEIHRSERRPTRATPRFTPSFDVREASNGYYLDGELPGVDQSKIDIEFSDPQTLIVKGRTERNYQQSPASASTVEQTSPSSSPRQHQATVEDDEEETASVSSSRSSTHDDTSSQLKQKLHAEPTQQRQPDFHFWASERSIGEFQRTFSFPTRVDQDGVRANLKNGILSVYVPKDAAPKTKKIRVL